MATYGAHQCLVFLFLAVLFSSAWADISPDEASMLEARLNQLETNFKEKMAGLRAKLEEEESKWADLESQLNVAGLGKAGIPSSCAELLNNGFRWSGFYLVHRSNVDVNSRIETVYCDFSQGGAGMETRLGSVDVKTSPVYFYVQQSGGKSFEKASGPIPWSVAKLNLGGAMNLGTGTFTAPVSGTYHFAFSGVDNSPQGEATKIFIRRNGANIGQAWADDSESSQLTMSLHSTFSLSAGEQVDLFLSFGSLAGSHSHFTGWLVEEHRA